MKLLPLTLAFSILVGGPLARAQINPGGDNPGGDGGGGGGAGADTLLFVTTGTGDERTVSGVGLLLSHLSRQDIGVITPAPGASAETFLDNANYNAMHGDKDCDAIWYDPNIGDAIDAITLCGDKALAKFPRSMNVFFSVKKTIGVPGVTAVMTPGDIASPRPGGTYSYMLTEAQIRSAFAIPANQPVDVDAVEKADDGTIYLSLEDDVWIFGGAVLALDGDMLMIDTADLAYNGCQVTAVTPGAGTIACYEAAWDAMVAMSGVANTAGMPVAAIGDLDALAFDDAGGAMWVSQGSAGAVMLPHFLFSGTTLDGAAVLSTQGGGSIAVMNGQPLASAAPVPTTGVQMGLLPGTAPVVRSIGGLTRLDHAPVRVAADASPMLPVPGDVIQIEWAGCDAGALTSLYYTAGAVAACGTAPSVLVPNPGFGFWFGGAAPLAFGPFAADPNGYVALAVPYAGGVPAGTYLVLQPATHKAGFGAAVLGGPVLLQF